MANPVCGFRVCSAPAHLVAPYGSPRKQSLPYPFLDPFQAEGAAQPSQSTRAPFALPKSVMFRHAPS